MRVFVSATSIVGGGALNILKQFILNSKPNIEFIIAINSQLELDAEYKNQENISFMKVSENNRLDRVKWDFWKAKNEIFKLKDKISLVVSLQNTTLNVGNIRQIVYVHQGLFLHDKHWNPLEGRERKYAFYKYIYPRFIFAFTKQTTQFVVQTEWMRNALINKFRVPQSNVFNCKPDIVPWSKNNIALDNKSDNDGLRLFYPATGEIFKNHLLILESILLLHRTFQESGKKLKLNVIFTLDVSPELNTHIYSYLNEHSSIEQYCNFTGTISYEQVKCYYDSCDVVIFPSYIESFGLPLLEAAMLGIQVISLNTGFAKEVLDGYAGVEFIDNEPALWAEHLSSLLDIGSNNHPLFVPNYRTSWRDFFELM